jgi:hypothetical protein
VELRVVDDDVDHGVPVGAADLQSLSGALGRAAAGHAPLDSQGIEGEGPLWVRETHAVQASAQRRGNGGRARTRTRSSMTCPSSPSSPG